MTANIEALIPRYRSKAEEDWALIGSIIIADETGQGVRLCLYEPITFRLLGNKYTPDFQYILEDGAIVFVEVKGSKKQKNYRDSRSKLRAAAETHPYFQWYMAVGKGTDWELERIGR